MVFKILRQTIYHDLSRRCGVTYNISTLSTQYTKSAPLS